MELQYSEQKHQKDKLHGLFTFDATPVSVSPKVH